VDFDGYSRAVRDADVGFVLTHPETQKWRLERTEFRNTCLQLGCDGGGSIADGISRSDTAILIWRVGSSPEDIYLNGELIGDDDLILLEPGSHFIFASRGPRRWNSVALPVCTFGERVGMSRCGSRAVVLSSPGSAEWLSLLSANIYRAAVSGLPTEELEQALIDGCLEALSASAHCETGRSDCFSKVGTALRALHRQDRLNCRIDELCDELGLRERTLLRAFHRVVGMGPKHYLLLRQLNIIRRALLDPAHSERHVTDVLTDCGVSELGRVAGQYKNLFGELPSKTLRCVRHTHHRGRIRSISDLSLHAASGDSGKL